MEFYSNLYPPVSKFRFSPSATTAVQAWTPTTSTRIVLVDYAISVAAPGTVQLRFGNVGGQIIAEHMFSGSSTFGYSFSVPRTSGTYDQGIFLESGMNGYVSVSLNGTEQD